MEKSKIVNLPQSEYNLNTIDPLQTVRIPSRLDQKDIIKLSNQDVMNILEWAYPDVVYAESVIPSEVTTVFPQIALIAIRKAHLDAGYLSYEVRYSEDANEFMLIGVTKGQRLPLVQWRKYNEVRSLRTLIDDATPLMKEWSTRHLHIGVLGLVLSCGAGALAFTQARLATLSENPPHNLLYAAYIFFALAAAAVFWFLMKYPKYLRASTVKMVEEKENERGEMFDLDSV